MKDGESYRNTKFGSGGEGAPGRRSNMGSAVRRNLALCLLVTIGLLVGCTTAQTPTVAPSAFASADTVATGAVAPAAAATGDYRIGPLDVLDISVFQVPDLSKTVQVTSNGLITLPLIGSVQAAGKTIAALQADITAKYGATYLQSPQVSVFVHDALSQRITINGEVAKPGVYPTDGPTTLLQSVAIAGGLTELADTNGVVVLRTVAGKREAAKFDFSAIQAGSINDPLLQGGDTVIVDRSGSKTAWRNIRQSLPVFGAFTPLL